MTDDGESSKGEDTLVIAMSGYRRDAIVPIVCCILFGLIALTCGPVSLTTGINGLFPLGIGIAFVGYGLYLSYHAVVDGEEPFVFDRRASQLRRGDKVVCQLSEISQVWAKEERGEDVSYYRLYLILADRRRVGFGPFLYFSEQGAESRKLQIEAFLKLTPPH